jgi:predicted SAM-dependent methyltransferase
MSEGATASVVSDNSDSQQAKIERLPPEHTSGIRRVQVGCGPKHLRPDWWNVDLRPFKGIDEVMDAAKPWRWDGLLDFVYCEHFLEHLDAEDGISFLCEAGRALRVGGRIRISTPGLEWVLKTHFKFEEPQSEAHLAQTFVINRAFHGWGHKFLYSRGMLEQVLRSLNYTDIKFFGYGESDTSALRNLELHGGYSTFGQFPSVWIVEGARGDVSIARSDDFDRRVNDSFTKYVRSGH